MMDIDDPRFALVLLFLVLATVSCLIFGYLLFEKHQWNKFSTEHHCFVIETRPARQSAGGGRRGGLTVYFQHKKYQCDDGKIYDSMW